MLSPEEVKKLIQDHVPDADVQVSDMTGTSDHFDVRVCSPVFAGKSLMDQHKMIHEALGEHLTTSIHAVNIKTMAPEGS